jgi:replicative DNA helicase
MTDKAPKPREKVPPYSAEAEMALIGSALLDPERVLELLIDMKVTSNDLYSPRHREIFLGVGEMHAKGKVIDIVTLGEHLESKGVLAKCGGGSYLGVLVDNTPTATSAEHYIEIIKKKSLSRAILSVAREIEGESYKTDDPEELRRKAEAVFIRMQTDKPKVTLNQGMDRIIADLERIRDGGEPRPMGPSTGFKGLDKALGGGMGAGVNFITGQPGTGKTSLVCNIILNQLRAGKRVAMVTLEMSIDDMLSKLISIISEKNIRNALVGLATAKMDKVREADILLRESGLFDIVDQSSIQDEKQFASWCRRKVMKDKAEIIVLDYLQLMELQDKKVQGEERVSQLTGAVKHVTASLGIPLLCIGEENKEGGIRYSDRGNYAGATHWRLLKVGDAEPRPPFFKQEFDVFTKKARFGVPNSKTPMVLIGDTGEIKELESEIDEFDYETDFEDLPGPGAEEIGPDEGLDLFDDHGIE